MRARCRRTQGTEHASTLSATGLASVLLQAGKLSEAESAQRTRSPRALLWSFLGSGSSALSAGIIGSATTDVALESVLRRAMARAGITNGYSHVCRKRGLRSAGCGSSGGQSGAAVPHKSARHIHSIAEKPPEPRRISSATPVGLSARDTGFEPVAFGSGGRAELVHRFRLRPTPRRSWACEPVHPTGWTFWTAPDAWAWDPNGTRSRGRR